MGRLRYLRLRVNQELAADEMSWGKEFCPACKMAWIMVNDGDEYELEPDSGKSFVRERDAGATAPEP
jgi:hypothetical protein